MKVNLTELSDSRLPILFKCLGPGYLQTSKHLSAPADAGHAIHAQLDARVKFGPAQAFAMIDEIVDEYDLPEIEAEIAKARCRSFEWNPPAGSGSELGLAWQVEGTKCKPVLVKGGAGSYTLPEGVGSPGTIDLIFSEPEPLIWENGLATCPKGSVLWVCDYKSGSEVWVDPVHRNAQVASGVAKAAVWTGAEQAIPAIIYIKRGEGIWEVEDEPWDMLKIKDAMRSIFELHTKIHEARSAKTKPPLVEGEHCRYCPSIAYCPAKAASVRSLVKAHTPKAPVVITQTDAAKLAQMYPVLSDLVRKLDEALKAYVREHGPIDIGGGKEYGFVEGVTDTLHPNVWLDLLKERLGDEALDAFKVTKAGVKGAIKAHHEKFNIERQQAAWMRDLMNTAKVQGGVTTEKKETLKVYRKPETETEEETS